MKLKEHPMYSAIRQYKADYGRSLMDRYGAHALGISWKDVEGESVPALIFYVVPASPRPESIPEFVQLTDRESRSVMIPTKVVFSEEAKFEK